MPAFIQEPQTFTAARDWFDRKADLPTELNARELSNRLPGRIRAASFFSAGVAKAHILQNLRSVTEDIQAGKIGYGQGRKLLTDFLATQGFGISEPGDPADRNIRDLASTARLELILRQNVAMAHAIGQREVSEHPAVMDLYPNYKYVAVGDERTRDSHAALDGLVLPKEHPFWATHYPPWDYNCRCMAIDTDEPVNGKAIGFEPETRNPKPESGTPDDMAQTGVVERNGQVANLTPNASGYVFQSNPATAFEAPDFDTVRDADLREQLKAEWRIRRAALVEKKSSPSEKMD